MYLSYSKPDILEERVRCDLKKALCPCTIKQSNNFVVFFFILPEKQDSDIFENIFQLFYEKNVLCTKPLFINKMNGEDNPPTSYPPRDQPSVLVPSLVVGVRVDSVLHTIDSLSDELSRARESVIFCKNKWWTSEIERRREVLDKQRAYCTMIDLRRRHDNATAHVAGLIDLLDKIVNDIDFNNGHAAHADRMRTNINRKLDQENVSGPRLSRKRPRSAIDNEPKAIGASIAEFAATANAATRE